MLGQSLDSFLVALARADAAPHLFRYCATNLADKRGVADAMARNTACPPDMLLRVNAHLTSTGVQALLDDLDRLTSSPALAAAVAVSPALTHEQRELFHELQKGAETPPAALEEAVAEAEPDPVKRLTLLQRLAHLNVVERVQLALKGGREERMAMIRDSNKVVQRAVLQSPRLTEQEVESFAAMSSLTSEVLRLIAGHRGFMRNYGVARNLAANPKSPLEVSLHLLPRLTPKDLKLLATNKNIPETLRTMAVKLNRQRSESRKGS